MVNLVADGSGNLDVNCTVGCAGGSFNNNADAVATSATNGQTAAWLYGFNGATFDRLQVDASKFLKVNCATGCSGGATTPTDAFANPTTASLNFDFLAGWNGATWDRLKESTANGLVVDVSRVPNAANCSSTACEVSPTTAANTKTNPFFDAPSDGANQITAAISALGTAPTGTEVETVQSVLLPFTSGGLSTSYTAAAASTNATNVKNAAGQVYSITATNTTTTAYYLRMYNLSSAPTCSSATGFVETLPVGGASAGSMGGFTRNTDIGQAYSTGIGYCITGGSGSTDNTNAAVGVYVTVLYK